ncbi:hypothetical protein GW17_00018231 [Ensete ventricosum]|nr:hypothetical protein GW17_00018231 [Ensete ventricosum]
MIRESRADGWRRDPPVHGNTQPCTTAEPHRPNISDVSRDRSRVPRGPCPFHKHFIERFPRGPCPSKEHFIERLPRVLRAARSMEYGALDEDTRLESRPPESGDVEPALFVEPPKLDTFLNAFADDGTELDLVTKASTTTTTTRTPTTENDSSDGGEVEKVESLKADLRWWIPSTSGQWLASIASSRALTPRDRVMVNGRPTQNPARIRAWTLYSLRSTVVGQRVSKSWVFGSSFGTI